MILAAALFAATALAEPPAVAQAHTNFVAAQRAVAKARREYMAERKKAGLAPERTRTAASSRKVLPKDAQKFLASRRICVSRDVTSVPGSVITTWYRNGKPDTQLPAVVTNVIRAVHGAAQTSPLADLADRWRQSAESFSNRLVTAYADYASMSNRWELSEQSSAALRATLENSRAEYVEKRDRAALATTKAIYQLFIDSIDRMLGAGGQ